MNVEIGIIGGSGLYDMAELTDREEVTLTTPFGDPSGPYVARHAARTPGGVSRAARRGTSAHAVRAELPREHLRDEDARRRVDPVGQRRRQAPRGARSRSTSSCPISSSTARQGRISTFFGRGLVAHVGFAHPICPVLSTIAGESAARRGRDGPPGRHVRVHGRAAVLDARRVERCIGRGAWTSSA